MIAHPSKRLSLLWRANLLALGFALAAPAAPALAQAGFTDLYERALEQAPALDEADANLESSEAAERGSEAAFWPQVSARIEQEGVLRDDEEPALTSDAREDFSRQSVRVNLDQTLFDVRAWREWEQSQQRVQARELEQVQARRTMMADLASRYLAVRSARLAADLAERELEALETESRQAEARFDQGRLSRAEFQEIQATRERAQAERVRAVQDISAARDELAELIGADVPSLKAINRDFDLYQPTPADIERLTEIALENNIALRLNARERAIQRQQIDISRAEYWPNASAFAEYQFFDDSDRGSDRGLFSEGDRYGELAVGLRLSVPFYSGGERGARVDQSEADLRAFDAQAEELRRQTRREVRTAYYDIIASISEIHARERSLESAEARLEQVSRNVELQRQSLVAQVQARRDVFRAERDLLEARFNYLEAYVRLYQGLGQLDEDFIAWLGEFTDPETTPGRPPAVR